jgi:histidine ammonia-lyase
MTIELASRADFTLDHFRRAAWQGEGVAFTKGAVERMAEARRQFLHLIDSDPDITVYGVTSGYGQFARLRFSLAERKQQAAKPPHGPNVAFGPPLPERVTRGIVFARLTNFVEGHSAISADLASTIARMLEQGSLPKVSMTGQGGAGEITSLAPLFYAVANRFALAEKENLALINGSPCATALLADAALAGRRRLALSEEVFALSSEAMKVPLAHFGADLEDLWGDPAEAATLSRLRSLIAGGDPERRPYQAPVSFRILPRVLAQYRRSVEAAETAAATSLRAITDNPVFLPAKKGEKPQVFSTGGYHNAMAYPAMDNIAAAMADLSLLADRHTSKLLDAKNSLLPDQLQKGDGYLGCLGMVQVGYAEQARRAAQRNFLPGSEGGGFGQNDVAPPSFFAWRAQEEAGRCLDAGLAMLGVVASQAFFVTDRAAPPALADLLALVRDHVKPLTDARVLADELAALAAALRNRVYDVAPTLREE